MNLHYKKFLILDLIFIDLRNTRPNLYKLPEGVKYFNYPIHNGKVPKDNDFLNLILLIYNEYISGNRIYIHCKGGNGRAGLTGAIVLGKIFNLSGQQSIKYIEEWRETRLDKSCNFIPTPETNEQVEYVLNILGVDPNLPIPNRDNKDWLTKISNEKKFIK